MRSKILVLDWIIGKKKKEEFCLPVSSKLFV